MRSALISRSTHGVFKALSRLRGKRIAHPHGILFEATVRIPRPVAGYGGVTLLAGAGTYAGLVRFSRSAGLPGDLPDVLGIGFRLEDIYGPSNHQDLLLVSSGTAPLARNALLPGTRGFFGHDFSTLLPYSLAGKVRLIGLKEPSRTETIRRLEPLRAAAPGSAYPLRIASLAGGWQEVGELEVGAPRSDDEAEALELTPWNCGGGIRLTGPLAELRRPAYEGSHEGRRERHG